MSLSLEMLFPRNVIRGEFSKNIRCGKQMANVYFGYQSSLARQGLAFPQFVPLASSWNEILRSNPVCLLLTGNPIGSNPTAQRVWAKPNPICQPGGTTLLSCEQVDVTSEKECAFFFFQDGAKFNFPQQDSSDIYLWKEQGVSWLVFLRSCSKFVVIYGVLWKNKSVRSYWAGHSCSFCYQKLFKIIFLWRPRLC